MESIVHSIDYRDWYINQKKKPPKDSVEYEAFYDFYREICQYGCRLEGEFINPFLFWHLNFWHTEISMVDDRGFIQERYLHPWFRDNEWIITNNIYRAQEEKKGLIIIGSRRLAKSVIQSSYIAWGATFDENSQNVVSGTNAADIKLITDKIDKGLNALPEAWRWQRIEDNWKNQVTLGIKTKEGARIPFSYIMIRNLDNGNNEEAIAGTKPRKLVIDEIGKADWLRAFQAAIPGFTTPFGWGCSPLLFGTSGDFKKFMDAKSAFFDCAQYNLLEFENEKNPKLKHGLFINNKYRLEAKDEKSLGEYLGKPEGSALYDIPMWVSNEEKANTLQEETLVLKKKAGDRQAYLKEKMYYPINVEDVFLNEDTNIFDIESCRYQQGRIRQANHTGVFIELHHDGEGIRHKFSEKMPLTNFPHKPGDSLDAPIVVWEMPVKDAPYGLYVAGVDPYRQGMTQYSSSLGAVYIYKRIHDITSEKYQDMFVASYVARPDNKEHWHEQARMLIKWYNAIALVENDELSFIDYMVAKGDGHFLQKTPDFVRELMPNSSSLTRPFGISRAAQKMRDYLHGSLKSYIEEVIGIEQDEDGSVIKEYKGVSKIYDNILLEEIIQYNEDDNFDRIIAAELAIAMAARMNPLIRNVTLQDDNRIAELYSKRGKRRGVFSNTPHPLFMNKRK